MRRWFVQVCLRLITLFGMGWPLAYLYRYAMVEVPSPAGTVNNRPKILFLNPTRYRGDIEAIAGTGRFRVFTMSQSWMGRTFGTFYPRHKYGPLDFLMANPSAQIAHARRNHRALLRTFWPALLRMQKIKLVIGAGYHYAQDRDYGFVTFESGIPFVLIHRETFKASPAHRADVLSRTAKFEPFKGTKIFCHNRLLGNLIVQSGFVKTQQIAITGSIRVDNFVAKLAKGKPKRNVPQVTLFSFFHRAGLNQSDPAFTNQFAGMWSVDGSAGFVQLFDEVHATIAELAVARPDVKFVVKTKWSEYWNDKIFTAIAKVGLDASAIPNLIITDQGDPADLIVASSAVVTFQSTTLAEALLSGCRVIYPYFAEARRPEYRDWLLLYEDRDLFDLATSKPELKQAISVALANPKIDKSTLPRRRAVFKKYASEVCGGVADNYIKEFNFLIDADI
ncbi:MAG TPA: hypothetical protein EYN14_05205 [Alphaproteobacteria bacterium]|nr:hypothetical protein [Alphaproteobacteria bacterium]